MANAVLGMALGLFLSAFAQTEFQAVQFMPAFVLPQILLSGLLVPREDMARLLELISAVLPLTYAYDALVLATADDLGADLLLDTAIVLVGDRSGAGPRCDDAAPPHGVEIPIEPKTGGPRKEEQ